MLEALIERLRKNSYLNEILTRVGTDSVVGRILVRAPYVYYSLFPDSKVKSAKAYFYVNKGEILKNLNTLSDDKSREIYKNLIRFRMTMKYRYHPGMELPQYFPDDIINLGENEVFLDVGGYDGGTSVEFIKQCQGRYNRIIIFEPDRSCAEMIKKNPYLASEKLTVIEKGAWDKEAVLGFMATGDSASKIIEDPSCDDTIPVTSIDLCEECRDATFIKMDIEGAEMKALEGARETIIRNKPKLAICIYHSDSDMVDIIHYIHDLVPEYKVYVRHHSTGIIETVAYFILSS